MSNIEIAAIVLVALAGLACWGFAIQKMVRDSRRMADEEELARRGPPIPWRPGLEQVDEEAPTIHRTREGTVSGGTPTILKTGYQRRRELAEHLEADVRRTARERVEARRSEEVSRRAREREQNEAEIRRDRRNRNDNPATGSIFPDFTQGMPAAPRPRFGDDDHAYVGKTPTFESGGGTSGGGGASAGWDTDKPVSAVSEAPSASSDSGSSYSSSSDSSSSSSSSDSGSSSSSD